MTYNILGQSHLQTQLSLVYEVFTDCLYFIFVFSVSFYLFIRIVFLYPPSVFRHFACTVQRPTHFCFCFVFCSNSFARKVRCQLLFKILPSPLPHLPPPRPRWSRATYTRDSERNIFDMQNTATRPVTYSRNCTPLFTGPGSHGAKKRPSLAVEMPNGNIPRVTDLHFQHSDVNYGSVIE